MGAYCTQWSWAIKCCGMQENILGTNTSWRTQLLERRCVRTVKPWTSSFLVSGYRTLYFKNMQHIMTQSGIGATTAVQVKGRRQICVVWTREMSSVAARVLWGVVNGTARALQQRAVGLISARREQPVLGKSSVKCSAGFHVSATVIHEPELYYNYKSECSYLLVCCQRLFFVHR